MKQPRPQGFSLKKNGWGKPWGLYMKEMPGFRDTRLVAQGYQLQILVSLLRCAG